MLLLAYIMAKCEDRRIKKDFDEDYENIIMSKSDIEKFTKYMNEYNDVMTKSKKDINII